MRLIFETTAYLVESDHRSDSNTLLCRNYSRSQTPLAGNVNKCITHTRVPFLDLRLPEALLPYTYVFLILFRSGASKLCVPDRRLGMRKNVIHLVLCLILLGVQSSNLHWLQVSE